MDSRADKVTGLLEKMRLSEMEKKSIRVGGASGVAGASSNRKDPQAVGKVLADNPITVEVLEAALGRIWCPLKGIECKELWMNQFFFTFSRDRGRGVQWRRAPGCLTMISLS